METAQGAIIVVTFLVAVMVELVGIVFFEQFWLTPVLLFVAVFLGVMWLDRRGWFDGAL